MWFLSVSRRHSPIILIRYAEFYWKFFVNFRLGDCIDRKYFTITTAWVIVTVCTILDPFFQRQRASVVENVRVITNVGDIRFALFASYSFFKFELFNAHLFLEFKHALPTCLLTLYHTTWATFSAPMTTGHILKGRHVHQKASNGISAYPILLYRCLALKPVVNRNHTTMTLAMRWRVSHINLSMCKHFFGSSRCKKRYEAKYNSLLGAWWFFCRWI